MDARTRCTFDLSAILQKLEVRSLVIHEHPEHSVTFDLSQILQKFEIRHIGWSFDIFAVFRGWKHEHLGHLTSYHYSWTLEAAFDLSECQAMTSWIDESRTNNFP